MRNCPEKSGPQNLEYRPLPGSGLQCGTMQLFQVRRCMIGQHRDSFVRRSRGCFLPIPGLMARKVVQVGARAPRPVEAGIRDAFGCADVKAGT